MTEEAKSNAFDSCFDENILAKISMEEREVQKTLNAMLHQSHANRVLREDKIQQDVPLISIPTSEFCSLNMRLLDRNNEVKLAMQTAAKAEAKLIEYRNSADQNMKNLKQQMMQQSVSQKCSNKKHRNTISKITQCNLTTDQTLKINQLLQDIQRQKQQKQQISDSFDCKLKASTQMINDQKKTIQNQQTEINRLQTMLDNLAQSKRRSTKAHRGVLNHIRTFKECITASTKDIKLILNETQNDSIFQINTSEIKQLQNKLNEKQFKSESNYKFLVDKYTQEKRLRKKCYNKLQELRGNIRVFARVRPILQNEIDAGYHDVVSYEESEDGIIEHITLLDEERLLTLSFDFDRIFTQNSTQKQVFDEISPLIESVLSGYNCCVFAYGQTGTGKTYTMNYLNIHTVSLLFEHINASSEMEYEIKVSLIEVYNERIGDLLQSKKQSSNKYSKPLKPVLKSDGKVVVPGLIVQSVSTEKELLAVLKKGNEIRKTGVTNLNEHSSRSHLILSVYVLGRNTLNQSVTESKLHLIDLAGSERNKKSGAKGDRFKEAVAINSSLAALGDVIAAKSKKSKHVPFRRSVLTFLLKDSLDADCKTTMIVQVSPTNRDVSESSCSLKFASRVKNVGLGKAKKNVKKAHA